MPETSGYPTSAALQSHSETNQATSQPTNKNTRHSYGNKSRTLVEKKIEEPETTYPPYCRHLILHTHTHKDSFSNISWEK